MLGWLINLTGRDPGLMPDPKEQRRFAAMGALMVCTTTLGALAGFLTARRTADASTLVACATALVVGSIVFAMDTLVVNADRDGGKVPVLPRLAMSLVLTLVLGHALVGQIFAPSIRPFEDEIVKERSQAVLKSDPAYQSALRDQTEAQNQVNQLTSQVADRKKANEQAEADYAALPPNDPGLGPAFNRGYRTRQDYDAARNDLEKARSQLRNATTTVNDAIAAATKRNDISKSQGLVVEIEAMGRLASEDGAALLGMLATLLVLMVMDLSVLVLVDIAVRNSEADNVMRRASAERADADLPEDLLRPYIMTTTRKSPTFRFSRAAPALVLVGVLAAIFGIRSSDRSESANQRGGTRSSPELKLTSAEVQRVAHETVRFKPIDRSPGSCAAIGESSAFRNLPYALAHLLDDPTLARKIIRATAAEFQSVTLPSYPDTRALRETAKALSSIAAASPPTEANRIALSSALDGLAETVGTTCGFE